MERQQSENLSDAIESTNKLQLSTFDAIENLQSIKKFLINEETDLSTAIGDTFFNNDSVKQEIISFINEENKLLQKLSNDLNTLHLILMDLSTLEALTNQVIKSKKLSKTMKFSSVFLPELIGENIKEIIEWH